jgi:hypothetical protein
MRIIWPTNPNRAIQAQQRDTREEKQKKSLGQARGQYLERENYANFSRYSLFHQKKWFVTTDAFKFY